jgi:hypothetical protein
MKTYLLLTSLFIFSACVQETTKPQAEAGGSSNTTSGGTSGAGGGTTITQGLTPAIVRVKNYNQYNQSLEKLTGLSRAKYNTLFEELKGSLPADNDIGGLTSFNLIAMTRLSDAYCKDWVDREETLGLNGKLNPLKPIDVREFLINTFLDVDKDEKFASLRTEVDNVLSNDDGSGGDLFPGYANNLASNKNITIAACVSILASPYITLLE